MPIQASAVRCVVFLKIHLTWYLLTITLMSAEVLAFRKIGRGVSMEKRISSESSRKISWLMFICSCLIVLRHSSGYDNYTMGSSPLDTVSIYIINMIRFNGIFNMVMPIFFFLSGFLFYKSFAPAQYPDKMKNRMHTLIIPYLAWNIFWMMVMAIIEVLPAVSTHINSMTRFTLNVDSVFRGVFLCLYNPSFWFMAQIILYAFASPMLYYMLKNRYAGGVLILILFIIYACNQKVPVIRMDGFTWYVMGAYLAMHCFEIINYQVSKEKAIAAFAILIMSAVIYDFIPKITAVNCIFTAIQLVFLWDTIDLMKNVNVKWWTKIHFYIYGLHQITQLCINRVICMVLPKSQFVLINFFGGAFLTVVVCIVSAYILKRWMKPIWAIANGGR